MSVFPAEGPPVRAAGSGAAPTPAPLVELAETDVNDVVGLVQRAREAQRAWAATPLADRTRAVMKAKHALLLEHDALAMLLHQECGKPIAEARLSELVPTADVFDWWAASIEDLLTPTDVELSRVAYPGKHGRSYRGPRGVIGLVTPWNYPLAIPLRTLVPALLAGNAVVWKPSEHASRVAKRMFEALSPHFPKGVLELVLGGGAQGEAIIAAGVDAIVFTGGTATGKRVLAACAEKLTLASVELGGKDAAVVLEDARLDRAARGIVWGAFTNTGQNCASIERVYVVEAIAKPFIDAVVKHASALELGRDVGSITTRAQAERVRAQVDEAIAAGAERLTPSPVDERDPRVMAPVVLRFDGKVVEDEVALLREETFGPVLPIIVVPAEDEAFQRVERSRFALTTSIWTRKIDRLAERAATLPTPVVTFNAHGITGAMPEAPWVGGRESGFGVTNSASSLSVLTTPRFVLEDRSGGREIYWYPYSQHLDAVASAMVKVRGGARFGGRIAAAFQLIGAFVKRLVEVLRSK